MSLASFANSFCHSIGYIWLCLWFPLFCESFSVNLVLFVYFCFYFHYFRRQISQNIAVIYVRWQSVLPMFSFRCFITPGLKFKCLIHFEFIFCMVLETVLISLFHMWLSSFLSATYWTDSLSTIAYPCLLWYWLIDCKCMGLFLGFLICSIDLCVCFLSVPYSFH